MHQDKTLHTLTHFALDPSQDATDFAAVRPKLVHFFSYCLPLAVSFLHKLFFYFVITAGVSASIFLLLQMSFPSHPTGKEIPIRAPSNLPVNVPPPECWGWELEYLVGRLFDYLDTCKTYGCLIVSTELDYAGLREKPQTPEFRRCVVSGGRELNHFLLKKYPLENVPSAEAQFQTPTLVAMTHACCLDDINLGHVFDLLRIGELLEHHTVPLTTPGKATLLCAILGELHIVSSDLRSAALVAPSNDADESENKTADERQRCISFLRKTESLILDLIADSGRDRATYMKEAFTRLPVAPPRPQWLLHDAFRSRKTNDGTVGNETHQDPHVQLAEESQADLHLETLLLSGSLISIWTRAEQLWNATGHRHHPPSSEDPWDRFPFEGSSVVTRVYNKIYWAVARAVRVMNRYRRLMFTRFLEMLASPLWVPDGPPQMAPVGLVRAVFNAFVSEAVHIPWPYEAERQRSTIFRCSLIPVDLRNRLKEIIVLADSVHFLLQDEKASGHQQRTRHRNPLNEHYSVLWKETFGDSPLLPGGELLFTKRRVDIDRNLFSRAVHHQLQYHNPGTGVDSII